MKAVDYLTLDELKYFTSRSDLEGGWLVLSNWLIIAAAFALVAIFPNVATLVLATVVLGGRQRGR